MTAQEFCYWLQGYFELSDGTHKSLTVDQAEVIRRHLSLVFVNRTGGAPAGDPVKMVTGITSGANASAGYTVHC
mgnify:CR=1 FL=1